MEAKTGGHDGDTLWRALNVSVKIQYLIEKEMKNYEGFLGIYSLWLRVEELKKEDIFLKNQGDDKEAILRFCYGQDLGHWSREYIVSLCLGMFRSSHVIY